MPWEVFPWDMCYLEEKHCIGNSRKIKEVTEEKVKGFCLQV